MSISTMEDLFLDELKDLHSAERQIVRALPKMIKAASSSELSEALSHHLEETKGHVERLDQIFEKIGKRGTGKTCVGMKGILDEGA
jgi:ferritin-like metal-binding protein YciE